MRSTAHSTLWLRFTRSACRTRHGIQRKDGFFIAILPPILALVFVLGLAGQARGEGPVPPTVLAKAEQVRALSARQAEAGPPVRLRGTVVMMGGQEFVMADETASIFVRSDSLFDSLQEGDLVEVTGVADPGTFAPFVHARQVVRVGEGSLPVPKVVTFQELRSGRLDAQWVEVRGIVRRTLSDPEPMGDARLWLATEGGSLLVILSQLQAATAAVDSEVVLRGVCFYQFNRAGQVLNPVLRVPAGEALSVTRLAPEDPYAVEPQSLGSLMRFSARDAYGHRVRVSGLVTYVASDASFWIQEEEYGLKVLTRETPMPQVGDAVEVLGFPSHDGYGPSLEDAVFRAGEEGGKPPDPLALRTPRQALDHNGILVEVEATLERFWPTRTGCELVLADGDRHFIATLQDTDVQTPPPGWLPGARVSATGISVVGTDPTPSEGTVEPLSFQLLLRSANDLRVLRPAPWWNSRRMAWLLAGVAGFLVCAIGWIVIGSRRRQRDQQVARLQAEAEFGAVWNERNRLARELHDTLAQGLGAISLQLQLVKRQLPPDSPALDPLREADTLAFSNLSEARRAIWNMRSQVLENGDLATALEGILKSLADSVQTACDFQLTGRPRRLAPVVENNLLRVGQEAISNAIRHAGAAMVRVVLEFGDHRVRLSVQDDGCGFDPAHPPRGEGGLGLVGMRERAEELRGEFRVTSSRQDGTVVEISVTIRPPAGAERIRTGHQTKP